MRDKEDLKRTLKRINGRGYKAYKYLEGSYDFSEYTLYIDHVQPDPFAPPSRFRVRFPMKSTGFPVETYKNKSREIALRDYITRVFYRNIGMGAVSIERPGQEILERSTVVLIPAFLEVRFKVSLPARGRRILSGEAGRIILEVLPGIVNRSLVYKNLNEEELFEHIKISEDADYIREHLKERSLVSFLRDGSILPRRSGVDPRPLQREKAVPFISPENLRVEFEVPNYGAIAGMGMPEGVTLIVGGGYHGKSTLLGAVQNGVYNHIPGDGREFVVTLRDAVKIRAEEGRRIQKVDISPFISELPFGRNTKDFSTENASGSTSQAANIIEAVESGTSLLLMDEDTSATNFLIRDCRMQELVPKSQEPITPFIDKVKYLYKEKGVSTILVLGGSGDYLDVADLVLCMVEYHPEDVTKKAGEIADKYPSGRKSEGEEGFGEVVNRIPIKESFDPSRGKRSVNISVKDTHTIIFGREKIDLSALEQIVDPSQTRAIANAVYYSTRYMDGRRTLKEVVDSVINDVSDRGLDVLGPYLSRAYAYFRRVDLAGAVNRLRSLNVIKSSRP